MSKVKSFTDDELQAYLFSLAEPDGFYVFRSSTIQPGLICYVDRNGVEWILMEDDDSLVEACVCYLERSGNPVFENHGAEQSHTAKLKDKYGG